MYDFSLVVPTLGRTDELKRLFNSLTEQESVSIELLIIDQNEDDRVVPVLRELGSGITVRHIRQTQKNVSMARNAGLSEATGSIIAFPDDDCWYPPQLLPRIAGWFAKKPEYDILSVGAVDDAGLPSGNRWIQSNCRIRPYNSLRTTFCNSLFIVRKAIPRKIAFDVDLVLGEETDYILRLMKAGCRGYLDRSLFVGHPRRDMLSGNVSQQRATRYGEGMGKLVRRHSMGAVWCGLLAYEVARTALVLLRGDFTSMQFCLAHTRGLITGFVEGVPIEP